MLIYFVPGVFLKRWYTVCLTPWLYEMSCSAIPPANSSLMCFSGFGCIGNNHSLRHLELATRRLHHSDKKPCYLAVKSLYILDLTICMQAGYPQWALFAVLMQISRNMKVMPHTTHTQTLYSHPIQRAFTKRTQMLNTLCRAVPDL